MKNDGKAYEELTEEVFRRLLGQELCADVARDVKVAGRSTTHQVDVFFRFRAAGVEYQTIVQCKDWANSVKQEQVLAFAHVLQDIPGQPRGIMVARSGFQEGARSVAAHHGIQLYELREQTDEDWNGLIREIRITMLFRMPSFRSLELQFDNEWFEREIARLGLAETSERLTVNLGPHGFFDLSGGPIDMRRVLATVAPGEPRGWTPFEHTFPEPIAVDVPSVRIPRRRVLGIRGDVRVDEDRRDISVRTDHLVAYCFRDVLGGTFEFLDASGARLGQGGDP